MSPRDFYCEAPIYRIDNEEKKDNAYSTEDDFIEEFMPSIDERLIEDARMDIAILQEQEAERARTGSQIGDTITSISLREVLEILMKIEEDEKNEYNEYIEQLREDNIFFQDEEDDEDEYNEYIEQLREDDIFFQDEEDDLDISQLYFS
jgi:hypothetical protein